VELPTIKLFANLRKIAETKELSVNETSLSGVLNELVKEVPALNGVILEDGQIRPHFVITINGHNVADLDVTVTEQDLIAIFPPIAGG
jgi:molybdopterin synthase sulfur carrier subunit